MSAPEIITNLAPGQVFVFGSNAAGIHAAGAARTAHERFGAVWGVGEGLTNRTSYALPTMEGPDALAAAVGRFLDFARSTPELTFLVTPVGCGIAGYVPADVAPLFAGAPDNVHLPVVFERVLADIGAAGLSLDARQVQLARGGDEARWWDVRARDERFVILTRQAPFKPKGELEYTIIDWTRGVRGPCNQIGQGWDKHMDDAACAELLRALNAHLEFHRFMEAESAAGRKGPWPMPDEPTVEVSYRNNVPIVIKAVRA